MATSRVVSMLSGFHCSTGWAALAAQMESGEPNDSARHYEIFICLMIGDGDTYY
jgi:hypothetical protein